MTIKNRSHHFKDLKFAIWGLSFKPNTDDTRESPAFKLIDMLLKKDALVQAYDPEAIENTKKVYKDKIEYFKDPYSVLKDVDAVLLITEWSLFRSVDFNKMKSLMKQYVIFDGRNQYDLEEMQNSGFEYHSIGRKSIYPKQ